MRNRLIKISMAISRLSYRATIKANLKQVRAPCSLSIRNMQWVMRVCGGSPSDILLILWPATVSNRRESTRRSADSPKKSIWKSQSYCKWSAIQPTSHHLEIRSSRVLTTSGRFKLGSRCSILMKLRTARIRALDRRFPSSASRLSVGTWWPTLTS